MFKPLWTSAALRAVLCVFSSAGTPSLGKTLVTFYKLFEWMLLAAAENSEIADNIRHTFSPHPFLASLKSHQQKTTPITSPPV